MTTDKKQQLTVNKCIRNYIKMRNDEEMREKKASFRMKFSLFYWTCDIGPI